MKSAIIPIIGLSAFVFASVNALAITSTLGPGDKQVTFSGVTTVDGEPDDGTCMKRYGAGFVTTDHPDNTPEVPKRATESGHDINLAAISGEFGEGIFSIDNDYEILFPDEPTRKPVNVKLFATGLSGSGEASGVFSDGTCRGRVHFKLLNQ